MIDGFEARLVNLIADRLAGTTELVSVERMRDGLPQPTVAGPRAYVMVTSAEPDTELGDDRQERLGERGSYSERIVVRLAGEVLIRVEVRDGTNPNQRVALVRALDRLLVTLQDEGVRTGEDFQTGADLGFALDGGFRLVRVITTTPTNTPPAHRHFSAIYTYAGRFWPVIPAVSGPAITSIPTRTTVLPMQLPTGLVARAGTALDIVIPVDMRTTSGAPARLAARLQGASPPGSLVGSTTGLPAGFVAAPITNGQITLRYQPPASLSTAIEVGIELRYVGTNGSLPVLETLTVQVLP